MQISRSRVGRAALAAALLFHCSQARALLQQTAPSNRPADPAVAAADALETAEITVVDMTGNVQASTDDGKSWQRAAVGLMVGQGAQFRTGERSSVICLI